MKEIERLPIDSELLRTFLAISATGTLTEAAGRLSRTQSAISVQLRKLEDGLGVLLFARTPKGMVLTPAGETLLPKARLIIAEMRDVGALFSDPLTGSIRLGLPDDFDDLILEQVLAEFATAHPGVDVIATSGCTSGFSTAIGNGTLDIAVCSSPMGDQGAALDVEETVWAGKSGAHWALDKPLPLAILERQCWWRDLPVNALDAIEREYEIVFRSSSFTSLQAAIRSGIAVGVLPESSVKPGITKLSSAQGFPNLPSSHQYILVAQNASLRLTDAMANAIRDAKSRVTQSRGK